MKLFHDRRLIILLLVCILVFTFKLSVSLGSDLFTEQSYFHLRQADSIKEGFIPKITDDLSYQGRTYHINPFFYYIIAFMPLALIKVFSSLLIISTSVIVYFIVKNFIKDDNIPLISALLSLFIPASVELSNSAISPISLFYPIFAVFILAYLKRRVWTSWPLLISMVLMIITSPLTLFIVLGLGIYLLLQRIRNLKPSKTDVEIILFFLFSSIWFFAVTYKDTLSGFKFIWGNTPTDLLYPAISAPELFSMIGMLPLLLGIIGANTVFDKKSRNQLLVLSMAIVLTLSLLAGLMPLIPGLALLGLVSSILSGFGLLKIKSLIEQSRFSIKKIITLFLSLVFITTTFIPFIESNVNQELPSEDKLEAIEYLSKVQGTVISSPEEAHIIMYYSGRKTYFDSYYAFSNAQERYDNSLIIFTGNSIFEAGRVLNEESIYHIFLSTETMDFFGIEELKIADLDNCIRREFQNDEVIIYENRCRIT